MRLLRLLESSSDTISLYRGDTSLIDKFDASKTDHNSLFGFGVYLTDTPAVARDYTVSVTGGVVFPDRSSGVRSFPTPKILVQAYIKSLMKKAGIEYDLAMVRQRVLDEFYRTNSYENRRTDEANAELNANHHKERQKVIQKHLADAKKAFQQQHPNLRITKTTTGNYALTTPNRPGHVTRFDVPREYIDQCLHAEQPMSDQVLTVVRDIFLSYRPGKGPDSNYDLSWVDKRTGEEHRFITFDEYIAGFKEHGSRYAWTDNYVGGNGENPSLDEIWNGTHSGSSVFYHRPEQERLISSLQALGYVGMVFEGGKQNGQGGPRGGGGIRHAAYVFWDADRLNSFRAAAEPVVDDDLEVGLHKGLRSNSIDIATFD